MMNEDLDQIFDQLSQAQQEFIMAHLSRGKRTKWLNVLAKKKGVVLTEDDLLSDDLPELEWDLVKVEDAGCISKNLRCLCGKALRYRYTVRHFETGVIYQLGSEHLEQYTGLDAQTVKAVVSGLKTIDLERDEILLRLREGWVLNIQLPANFVMPPNLASQLQLGLPLLKRQEQQLMKLIRGSSAGKQQSMTAEGGSSELPFDEELFERLYRRFEKAEIDADQAKQFFELVACHSSEVEALGYNLHALSKLAQRIAGQFGQNQIGIRVWVCRVWELFE